MHPTQEASSDHLNTAEQLNTAAQAAEQVHQNPCRGNLDEASYSLLLSWERDEQAFVLVTSIRTSTIEALEANRLTHAAHQATAIARTADELRTAAQMHTLAAIAWNACSSD